MSFGETHRYAVATAKIRHSPGTPLSSSAPRSSNSIPDPITRSRSVLDSSTSFRPASALRRAPMCTAIPPIVSAADLAFAGVQTGAHLDVERLHCLADRHGAADRSLRAVEHRQEPVTSAVHLATSEAVQLDPHDGVVGIEQGMPVTVTHLCGSARRVHDVGEKHRGQHAIIGDLSLVAGEELGDLLEGLAPSRFNGVIPVASR